MHGQGPYGTNVGVYPTGISVDTTGYREVIIHEFLHLFGISEGYDERSKKNTCEPDCLMQWNATNGNRLCKKHLNEIKKFIKK